MPEKRVIVVTDGDCAAREAVEVAARNIGGRCISLSGSLHPGDKPLQADKIAELVMSAPQDPVVVMVDDTGKAGAGNGEKVLQHLIEHPDIDIMGVVAVASNSPNGKGVHVDGSISRDGVEVSGAVDKQGYPQVSEVLHGDTVDNLEKMDIPVIIGLGDPGKMDYADDAAKGAPITTKALQAIMAKAGRN